jgi:tyrosyl-tRNA synthetase
LTDAEIRANMQTYLDQASKILDLSLTHVVYNSEWLRPLALSQLIGYAMQINVSTLLEREDFAQRLSEQQPVGLHEFLYPLIQAIDSVHLGADVEIGGWDQRLNLLMTRELQKKLGKPEQQLVLMKPLIGLDGEIKMSSSKYNYVGLTEAADQMFGKLMRVPDKLIDNYAELAAWLPQAERRRLANLLPREAKFVVAQKIVAQFWDEATAERAAQNFNQTFRDRQPSVDLITKIIVNSSLITPQQLVAQSAGVSMSEASRLIKQGGVRINGQVVTDPSQNLELADTPLQLQIGKYKFFAVHYQ